MLRTLVSLFFLLSCSLEAEVLTSNLRAVASPILPEEKEQGKELLIYLTKEYTFVNDLIVREYLAQLGDRLLAKTELANNERRYLVLQDDSLNAFAGPAGVIGVNVGTFQACQHEGELAAILAHEIAHLTQKHLQQLGKRAKVDTMAAYLGLIVGAIISKTVDSDLAAGVTMGSLGGIVQGQLNFSRANEQEADQIGLKILFATGFDPLWMPRVFERFQKVALQYQEHSSKWLSTHPLDSERISYTYDQALSYPKRKHYEVDYTYNLVRARLAFLLNKPLNQQSGEIGKIERAYYNFLTGMKNKEEEKVMSTLLFLKEKMSKNYLILISEAEANFYFERKELAFTQMEEVYQQFPLNLVVILKYVEMLNHAKAWDKSQVILREALLKTDKTELLENLINVYSKKGLKINAYFTKIKLYERMDERGKALSLVRQLLKNKDLSIIQRSRLEAKENELKK